MIIPFHGRRQVLDRTRCKQCLCVTFTCRHRDRFEDRKSSDGDGVGIPQH